MHFLSYLSWATLGRVLYASLPAVISGIVAYIAWQQFVVNRRQHRLALFEKRLAVFNSTITMIAAVVEHANATYVQCFQFIQDTREHEFLFGPEVGEFINEVYKKAVAVHNYIAAYDSKNPRNPAELTQLVAWFADQMREARKVFLPYLDFRKP